MENYQIIAENVLSGKGYMMTDYYKSYRMPGFVYYLIGIYKVFGLRNYLAVRMMQVVMSGLACLMVFYIAKSIGGPLSGLLASFLFTFSKEMTFWAGKLSTEFPDSFALLSCLLCFTLFAQRPAKKLLMLAALFMALSSLIRSSGYILLPCSLLWLALFMRKSPYRFPWIKLSRWIGLFLFVFALVISPWAIRNYRVHGVFMLASTQSGHTLLDNNNPRVKIGGPHERSLRLEMRKVWEGKVDEIELDKILRKEAMDFILSDPLRYARLCLGRLSFMFTSRFMPLTHVSYDDLTFYKGFVIPLIGWTNLFLLLSLFSLGFLKKTPSTYSLTLGLVLISVLTLMLISADARKRDPLLPEFFILASFGLTVIGEKVVKVGRRFREAL